MTELTDLTRNQLDALLKKYFIDHSSRRLNFLYWNVGDQKDQYLQFINLTGKELNRINNNDLVYRLVKVKNQDDWNVISSFISRFLTFENDKKNIYVIRVDYLMTYLKTIKFNLEEFELAWEQYGIGYLYNDNPDKRKPVVFVNDDIQSIYLINQLFLKYKKFININDIPDATITDILNMYLESDELKLGIIEGNNHVYLPTTEALDIVAKKFIQQYQNKRLEQIYIKNALSTVMSKFVCSDMTIISVRAYIQVFLKHYLSKKVKKNG